MTAPVSTGKTPSLLVGREREQDRLRDQLAAALTGQGSLVVIGGEAGIGKTALAVSVCQGAAQQGAQVLVGRCYDLTETPPYGPWLELFACYHPVGDQPSLPTALTERGGAGDFASTDVLFAGIRDFLVAVAATQPLVLMLDDLHWADPVSLDLLRFLARSLAAVPILIVVTYRAEEVHRQHPLHLLIPLLVRESSAVRLDVRRLTDADVQALVAARYHLSETDAVRLVTYLQLHAEGNAFYLGELLRSLEEENLVWRSKEGWMIGDLTETRIPTLLRQVIEGRLARLGDDVQPLLAVAAVIGQEASFALWATVAGTDEASLLAVVERAAAASLMDETPDGRGVRFAHALVRETIYEGLRPSQRRTLHRQVGEALTAQSGTPDPDAVASHFQRAGDDRAAEWLVKAGERAQRTDVWRSAADRYEVALALMETRGTDQRDLGWLRYRFGILRRFSDPQSSMAALEQAASLAVETGDNMLLAYALYSQGLGHCMYRNNTRGVALIETGIEAIERLTPADRTGRDELDVLHANANRGQVIGKLADIGRFSDARIMAEAYRATLPDPALTPHDRLAYGGLNSALKAIHAFQGRPDEARLALARALDVGDAPGGDAHRGMCLMWGLVEIILPYYADDVEERRRVAMDAERAWMEASSAVFLNRPARTARIPLLVLEGAWDDARFLSLGAITGLAPDAITGKRNWHSYLVGALLCAQGETALAWAVVREWLPDGPNSLPGCAWYVAAITLQRVAAACALVAGDFETARQWLEAHDRWMAWSGAVLGQAEGHLAWAKYHQVTGDADPACQRAMKSFACATEPRQPLALLAAHRLLGELDTDASRFGDAAAHLDAALALADACAAPYERALTLLAIAEFRAITHETAQARLMLDEARAICIPLDAKPALDRIDRLFTRLNTKGAAPNYPAGLSLREVEVLRLIVAGQTNREIATALFLAEKTVERHITHILTKTNAANRAAAVTFASRHGLI